MMHEKHKMPNGMMMTDKEMQKITKGMPSKEMKKMIKRKMKKIPKNI